MQLACHRLGADVVAKPFGKDCLGLVDAVGGVRVLEPRVLVAGESQPQQVVDDAGQHLLDRSGATDASGNLLLGDVADLLRSEIKRYMDARGIPHALKYIDPSYIIRSVPATANDKVYCGFLGQYAVHAAMAGRTDMVVGKIQDRYVHLPLELVTRRRRKLNIYSDLWRAALESTGQGMLAGMLPQQETHG